jgi:hypothetical protein
VKAAATRVEWKDERRMRWPSWWEGIRMPAPCAAGTLYV